MDARAVTATGRAVLLDVHVDQFTEAGRRTMRAMRADPLFTSPPTRHARPNFCTAASRLVRSVLPVQPLREAQLIVNPPWTSLIWITFSAVPVN